MTLARYAGINRPEGLALNFSRLLDELNQLKIQQPQVYEKIVPVFIDRLEIIKEIVLQIETGGVPVNIIIGGQSLYNIFAFDLSTVSERILMNELVDLKPDIYVVDSVKSTDNTILTVA